MSALLKKLRSQSNSHSDLVDKLLAKKKISKAQAETMYDVKVDWQAGLISSGADRVQEIVGEEIAAVLSIPRTTFQSWLGRRGVKNVR